MKLNELGINYARIFIGNVNLSLILSINKLKNTTTQVEPRLLSIFTYDNVHNQNKLYHNRFANLDYQSILKLIREFLCLDNNFREQ